MDMTLWIVIFLMIFMLHNLEEIITVEKWTKKTYPRIKHKIPSSVQKELDNMNITSAQFAMIVFIVSVFASILILVALYMEQNFIILGIHIIFAVNIFSHPLQSLFLRCYVPGVVTSILLIIPYYIFFFYHFIKTELFSLPSVVGAIILVVIFIPLFLGMHRLGRKWRV